MRSSRFVSIVLGLGLLVTAMLPLAAFAQAGLPGVTGGGSAFQYVGDDSPTAPAATLGIDRIVLQHFYQARSMAARWLAASRLAGTRASSSIHLGRVR